MMSVAPPGGKATTMRTGLVGKVWACAALVTIAVRAATMRQVRIVFSPLRPAPMKRRTSSNFVAAIAQFLHHPNAQLIRHRHSKVLAGRQAFLRDRWQSLEKLLPGGAPIECGKLPHLVGRKVARVDQGPRPAQRCSRAQTRS